MNPTSPTVAPAAGLDLSTDLSADFSAELPIAQLLRVALLGTRRSGEALPRLPGLAPDPSAPADDPDAREKQLLLSAGALALAQKAGFQPPAIAAAFPTPAPSETWTPLGPLGAECLRALLSSNRYTGFLDYFISQLQAHRRLIPPALLVPVLGHEGFWRLAGPRAAVLGERGRWLAQQNPDWQALLATAPAPEGQAANLGDNPTGSLATWETGTLSERRRFLRQLHQTDPPRARTLLQAALPTEPAATQAAFLSELEHSVTPADAPLLEFYLKAKSKEVRQTVVPLLVRLPGSALAGRLWLRAAALLTVQRPLLGRSKLRVELPGPWDKSWLADGIEQNNAGLAEGERAGRLSQLLSLLPPSRWAAHFQLAAEELLALAENTEWARLLLQAWARATYLHQDKPFAAPLLRRHFAQPGLLAPPQAAHLAEVLSDDEKLALLRSQLPPQAKELPGFLPELLGFIRAPYPPDAVRAALRYVAGELAPAITSQYAEPYQRLASLCRSLETGVPDAQATLCAETLRPVAETHPLVRPLVEQFLEGLKFRQQLTASLSEPAE